MISNKFLKRLNNFLDNLDESYEIIKVKSEDKIFIIIGKIVYSFNCDATLDEIKHTIKRNNENKNDECEICFNEYLIESVGCGKCLKRICRRCHDMIMENEEIYICPFCRQLNI